MRYWNYFLSDLFLYFLFGIRDKIQNDKVDMTLGDINQLLVQVIAFALSNFSLQDFSEPNVDSHRYEDALGGMLGWRLASIT